MLHQSASGWQNFKCILIDSIVYEKICSSLNNKRLKNGIMQASPILCKFYMILSIFFLHSFCTSRASTILKICFRGTLTIMYCNCCDMHFQFSIFIFCRHVIANMHFNKNLSREKRMKGSVEQYVVCPKFMNGEAVVRKVPVKQDFGMHKI